MGEQKTEGEPERDAATPPEPPRERSASEIAWKCRTTFFVRGWWRPTPPRPAELGE